ncbi:MAG: TatD family hydrolase [Gemmatimonadota bacterium]
MLVDSHCHLDQVPDPEGALGEAAAAGVSLVAAVSQDRVSMAAALDLRARFAGRVLAGLGVHPEYVTRQPPEETDADLTFLADHLAEADLVGETGLDYKWAVEEGQRHRQDQVLERHFELAAAHRKPVNLHSRRSQRQVMERAVAFTRATGLAAQLHWFTHSRKLVHHCNGAGLYVSVGPSLLDDEPTCQVALAIADDLLLLETDTPVTIGGVAGHPRRLRAVAQKLAVLKGVSVQELAAGTTANFRRYLGGS